MNHPTKYVIQFICEKITNILDNTKCIIYKCISKNVNLI